MSGASRRARAQRTAGSAADRVRLLGCAVAFGLAALLVYARALDGPFVSDDLHYVVNNPYVSGSASLLGILDPRGEAVTLTENYAPLHLLLHRAAWRAFGSDVRGHHLANLAGHVAAALVLLLLLRRSGLAPGAALFGAAAFLLHPAHVEAVAWISQLKSTVSLALAGLALLLFERRPALGTLAFGLALLTKPTAAFALPVAAVFWWVRGGWRAHAPRALARDRSLRWLGAWALLFLAFAAVELGAFAGASGHVSPLHPELGVRLRSSVALAGRYLAMAATTWGLSAFHEPAPAVSLLDPWWLLGLAALVALAGRTLWALRRHREEAAWWVWAGVSFLPVSQLLPFPYPLADRYLYPILAGLIGGTLLALAPLLERAAGRARVATAVLGLGVLAALAGRAEPRVALWRSPLLLQADAARHYPDGVSAHLLRARRAATEGQGAEAVAALEGAVARGFDRFDQVLGDPAYAPLAGTPGLERVVAEMAGRWIARLAPRQDLGQSQLLTLALAHRLRGERAEAREALERGLRRGGPLDARLRHELREVARAPSSDQPANPR